MQVVAWWLAYAAQTSKTLANVQLQLTPNFRCCAAQQCCEDLRAAGASAEIVLATGFSSHIFRVAPELKNIGIASGKENFGRCIVCGDLEEAIRKARYSGDANMLLRKKQERLDHTKRERADKLA
eukprot:3338822-Pleurochrysis_carterae.AAC.1